MLPEIDKEDLPDEAKILHHAVNNAVIQLPYRNYPGVLLQGDTLYLLYSTLREAKKSNDIVEIKSLVERVEVRLKQSLDIYEIALKEQGFTHPPYTKMFDDEEI